jgi:hypothetical protein
MEAPQAVTPQTPEETMAELRQRMTVDLALKAVGNVLRVCLNALRSEREVMMVLRKLHEETGYLVGAIERTTPEEVPEPSTTPGEVLTDEEASSHEQ